LSSIVWLARHPTFAWQTGKLERWHRWCSTPRFIGKAMPFAEYEEYDAVDLAALVARSEVTPLDLVDAAIRRAEELNPRLAARIEACGDLVEP
jgi:hypothetical protein